MNDLLPMHRESHGSYEEDATRALLFAFGITFVLGSAFGAAIVLIVQRLS